MPFEHHLPTFRGQLRDAEGRHSQKSGNVATVIAHRLGADFSEFLPGKLALKEALVRHEDIVSIKKSEGIDEDTGMYVLPCERRAAVARGGCIIRK